MEAQLRARMMQAKQDFARLMLGMFAGTTRHSLSPMHTSAQAEAPQGKADVIDVKGPANFSARLFVGDNGLPIMLSWQAAGRTDGPGGPGAMARPGGPPPAGAGPSGWRPASRWCAGTGPAGPPPGAKPAPEQRMFFADYRDVDGLEAALPHPARRRRGDDRRNNFRSLPDQREG